MFESTNTGNSVVGRSPRDSSVLRVEFSGTTITAVDELIHPPAIEN